MKLTITSLVVFGLLALGLCFEVCAQATNTKAEAEIRVLVHASVEAMQRGEKAFFEQYLADDYFETGANGTVSKRADLLKQLSPFPPQFKFTFNLEDLTVRLHGDIALVSYRAVVQFDLPDDKSVEKYQHTMVLRRVGKRWQVLTDHDSRLPKPPVAVKVEPKLLDEYAGEYQSSFEQERVIITREGDKLMMAASDGSIGISELTPESDTVFRTRSGAYQRVFVRDAQGRVTHMIARALDGQDATKLTKIK